MEIDRRRTRDHRIEHIGRTSPLDLALVQRGGFRMAATTGAYSGRGGARALRRLSWICAGQPFAHWAAASRAKSG